jgi:hypothetical protein
MDTTAPRKKSAAYEAGMREGREDKNKAPKVEVEIEAPEEEAQEGPEDEEMDGASGTAKSSRKRSAKGAKNTKAPMDAECGCGNKGRKGKAACDGSCGKAMKDGSYAMKGRNDALTPQEYLAACDLGIQGRSRTYIRARLDTAERLDLKCGNGAISEGEKCTKGAAQKVDPRAKRGSMKGGSKVRGLKTAAKIAAVAALVGGAAYMQQTARRNMLQRGATAKPGTPSNTAFLNEVRRTGGNNETAARARRRQVEKKGATPAQWAEWRKSVPKSGSTAAEREKFKDFFYKNTRGARRPKADSVYASGFTLDTSSLAI